MDISMDIHIHGKPGNNSDITVSQLDENKLQAFGITADCMQQDYQHHLPLLLQILSSNRSFSRYNAAFK